MRYGMIVGCEKKKKKWIEKEHIQLQENSVDIYS